MRAKKRSKSMLADVVGTVESMVKTAPSLRDDPKVKEMTTLMLAGRAAERQDMHEFVGKIEALRLNTARGALELLKDWLDERDERANR